MALWVGSIRDFVELCRSRTVDRELRDAFIERYGEEPDEREQNSWARSLPALARVVAGQGMGEAYIALDLGLPRCNKRVDAVLFGQNASGEPHAVLVELKQWSSVYEVESSGEFVRVPHRDKLPIHPSRQVMDYLNYLSDMHGAFRGEVPVGLTGCVYLHNGSTASCAEARGDRYKRLVRTIPLFTREQAADLGDFLRDAVGHGTGATVWERYRTAPVHVPEDALERVTAVIRGDPAFAPVAEQRDVLNRIWSAMRDSSTESGSTKHVLIVRGGPGTGKTVVALNTLALATHNGLDVRFVTGSKALTMNLKAKAGDDGKVFGYFNTVSDRDRIGVLIADEAHRLRGGDQAATLIRAAERAIIFFQDDNQIILPNERGTFETIYEAAAQCAEEDGSIEIKELDLTTQFRSGAAGYIQWVDALLGIPNAPPQPWVHQYKFILCDSPEQMESLVQAHYDPSRDNGRMVAGYCWNWERKAQADGTLHPDVSIGEWRRPWNVSDDVEREWIGSGDEATIRYRNRQYQRRVANPAESAYTIWATHREGFGQVGCIFSSQSLEYDYVGVIIGPDLVWRGNRWVGQQRRNHYPAVRNATVRDITPYIRNTYRVLLTRGKCGTFLYVVDPETRKHVHELLKTAQ